MAEQIPLARPDLGEREEELVLEVLRSGSLSLGPKLGEFELAFASWLGSDDAVAVSSGTAGLHLGVRALGWGEGDEVLTTPFSFVASSNCLLYEGAAPVFCDIDPVTLNIDPAAAEAAAGERTAGILPVHIFGYPADLIALERLADTREIPILEDACQALGAVDSEGRAIGTAGHVTSFAFYANKQMTTGEGGVLIPAGGEMAGRLRSERNQGRSDDMSEVDHERIGFNYRMTDIQAAIGLGQVERLDELLAARAEIATTYTGVLSAAGAAPAGDGDPQGLVLPSADRGDEQRSWFVYPVQLPVDAERAAVIAALAAEGIQSKAYLPCIHTMPPYRERFGFKGGEFPVAEAVAARSLALPFFGSMTESNVERVCAALARAVGFAPEGK
ncbi:MAG TPA: DegT/DnrJ/EryC1/StrS family aminotransferase [Solirubrobacterales bacterium]|nr:DegT/DnrJ/EryC1/StrS family aminotransferase [Solirubrobacterales bacterium]